MADDPRQQKSGQQKAAIAAAVTLIASVTAYYEGTRTKPYVDPSGNLTVCIGETAVPMKEYSVAECQAILKARQTNDFAPLVLRVVPSLALPQNKWRLAASIDFSYNVGSFAHTSMARDFRINAWSQGCDAFMLYRFATDTRTHKKIELPGLVSRRACERSLCDHIPQDIKRYCPKGTAT